MKAGVFLFLFLITLNFSFCQSPGFAFKKLSCPEKWWVVFHPFIAKKTYRISIEARQYAEDLKKDTLLDQDADGGQVDAFRHSYWMARLCQEIRWRKARRLGKAHERGNYLDFRHKRRGEEIFSDSVSTAMDLHNNEVGINAGRESRKMSPGELRLSILADVRAGKMKIVFKDKFGNSLGCDRRKIDLEKFSGEWNIPRCLVSSDTPRH